MSRNSCSLCLSQYRYAPEDARMNAPARHSRPIPIVRMQLWSRQCGAALHPLGAPCCFGATASGRTEQAVCSCPLPAAGQGRGGKQ